MFGINSQQEIPKRSESENDLLFNNLFHKRCGKTVNNLCGFNETGK